MEDSLGSEIGGGNRSIARRYVQPNQRGNVRTKQHVARSDATAHAYVLESSTSEAITELSPERKIESDLAKSRYKPKSGWLIGGGG